MVSALQVRTLPSWAAQRTTSPPAERRWLVPLVLALVFFALAMATSLVRDEHFQQASWDLGIFTEAVKNYAHLRAPVADIKGAGANVLGDHWSPILAPLGALWWAWPSPVLLLAVQNALFAWSVWVLAETANRFLSRERAVLLAIAYGLSFGIQRAVDVDFHEIAFAVPLLALVARQLLLRRWARACWWAVPLVLVKEDLGLTVAAVGVVVGLLARDWPRRRRWLMGALLVVFGLAATCLAVLWLIPHFNAAHHFDYWTKVAGGAHHPHWSMLWAPFTRWTVWITALWTFGVAAFSCLRSPLLLLALPTLLWRFTADDATYWGTGWHYSAVLMPIVFLSAVDGIDRAARSNRPVVRRYATGVPSAVAGVAVAMTLTLPMGAGNLLLRDAWRLQPRDRALAGAERVIPPGVTVECDNPLLATLAARDTVYWPGGDEKAPPAFIVDDSGVDPEDMLRWANSGHQGASYRVVYHRDAVTVAQLLSA